MKGQTEERITSSETLLLFRRALRAAEALPAGEARRWTVINAANGLAAYDPKSARDAARAVHAPVPGTATSPPPPPPLLPAPLPPGPQGFPGSPGGNPSSSFSPSFSTIMWRHQHLPRQ